MPTERPERPTDETIQSIVKRKRTNYPNDPANLDLDPGDNSKYIDFALTSFRTPRVDLTDPDAVMDRITGYFARCRDADIKPGVVGLSNALGVSRQTVWNLKTGARNKGSEYKASVDLIKRAYDLLEELWERYMLEGKVSPPNGIFLGKNHFGYKDVQDVVVTPNNPLDGMDQAEARNRYAGAIPEIATDTADE